MKNSEKTQPEAAEKRRAMAKTGAGRAVRYLRDFAVPRKILPLLIDIAIIVAALYVSLVLRFDSLWEEPYFSNVFRHVFEITCAYVLFFLFGRLYDVLWRFAGLREVMQLGLLCAGAGMVSVVLCMVFRWGASRGALIIHAGLTVAIVGLSRVCWRYISQRRALRRGKGASSGAERAVRPRLMIVGAGVAGSYVMSMCAGDPSLGIPVVCVDDANSKQHLMVRGVPVAGKVADIPELVAAYQVSDIMIAIPSLRGEALSKIVRTCTETGCRVRISSFAQNPDEVANLPENLIVRDPNITDLLSRDEVALDTASISEYLSGKCVLVSGGGGSIGSELCRQIMRFSPRLLLVFDIYENNAYDLECELRQLYGADCPLEVLIGSVRDYERLEEIFSQYRPEVVFHAAAHKHVPLMEASPAEAVKNNVFGTLNMLRVADAYGVGRFVQLSTDKAVNPGNVMGATKRVTEMLIQYFAKKTDMKCMAVRFGNVLGSHGSVIPLFERQIKSGGPVTVTHPDITRYFMTIAEAAQLVLQAGGQAVPGAIFVLDMGEPVSILDLAEQMIRFYGYEPNGSIRIVYTGLRPGEKLYEELLTEHERDRMQTTKHDKIMIAPPLEQNEKQFEMQLEVLKTACAANDMRVVEVLHTLVPEFRDQSVQSA